MSNLLKRFMCIVMLFISNYTHASASILPEGIFIIDNLRIGEATFDDIKSKFGSANTFKRSALEESDILICYSSSIKQRKAYLIFESGAMGGFNRITGFRLTNNFINKNCSNTEVDLLSLKTGAGVRLKQTKNDFLRIHKVNFRLKKNSKLLYQNESKREATEEERQELQKNWPEEKQYYFDVLVNIEAKFRNNLLIEYKASRVESF